MPEGIIDMGDMETIFTVTDSLGIHRESVRVELTKEDPGSVGRDGSGNIEITVPETEAIEQFSQRLEADLVALGYTAPEPGESGSGEDGEEDEEWAPG